MNKFWLEYLQIDILLSLTDPSSVKTISFWVILLLPPLSQSFFSSKKYVRITENFNCLLICNDWIILILLHRTPFDSVHHFINITFNTWKYSYANFYMPLQSSSFHLKNKWHQLSPLIQLLFEVRRESVQHIVKTIHDTGRRHFLFTCKH